MTRKRDQAWNYLINLQNRNGVLFERDIETVLNRYMLSLRDRNWIYKTIAEKGIYVSVLPDNNSNADKSVDLETQAGTVGHGTGNRKNAHDYQQSKKSLVSKNNQNQTFPGLKSTANTLKSQDSDQYSFDKNAKLIKSIPDKYVEIKSLTKSLYYSDESETVKNDIHAIIQLAHYYSKKNQLDFEILLSDCFYVYATKTDKNGKPNLRKAKQSINKYVLEISQKNQVNTLVDDNSCFYCEHLQYCLLSALRQQNNQNPEYESLMAQYIDDCYSEIELDGCLNSTITPSFPCFKPANVNSSITIQNYYKNEAIIVHRLDEIIGQLSLEEREMLRVYLINTDSSVALLKIADRYNISQSSARWKITRIVKIIRKALNSTQVI